MRSLLNTTKPKPKPKRFNPDDFEPPSGSIPEKMAKLLDWAAEEAPGVVLRYPQIAKALLGMTKTPRKDSKEVDMIRGRVSPTRQRLIKYYERDLVTETGIGCRATISDADALENCVTKRARRLMIAKDRLVESINIIQEEGLLESSDIPELAQWLSDELKPLIKELQKPRSVKALSPPPPRDDDDENGD